MHLRFLSGAIYYLFTIRPPREVYAGDSGAVDMWEVIKHISFGSFGCLSTEGKDACGGSLGPAAFKRERKRRDLEKDK